MSKKVLICDDTEFMRNVLKDILTKNGYEVIGEAENGKIAVEKYNELRPDITLMDITMPVMDGIKALSVITKIDSNAKVIVCSAMGQEEVVLSAIRTGAKDFIVKPFQHERVLESINKVIGN